jgi:hypothetical protein
MRTKEREGNDSAESLSPRPSMGAWRISGKRCYSYRGPLVRGQKTRDSGKPVTLYL